MSRLSLWRKYTLPYEYGKRKQKAMMWLSYHLPKELRMWVVVMAFAEATTKNNKTPDNTGYTDVMVQFK